MSSDELHLNAVMKGDGKEMAMGCKTTHSCLKLQEGDNEVKAGGHY